MAKNKWWLHKKGIEKFVQNIEIESSWVNSQRVINLILNNTVFSSQIVVPNNIMAAQQMMHLNQEDRLTLTYGDSTIFDIRIEETGTTSMSTIMDDSRTEMRIINNETLREDIY